MNDTYDQTTLKTLSRAYAAFKKTDSRHILGTWLHEAVAGLLHNKHTLHSLAGWDRAVYHRHSPAVVQKVLSGFFDQLSDDGFSDSVLINGRKRRLSLQESIDNINREWSLTGEHPPIELKSEKGWVLGKDLPDADDSEGAGYKFVTVLYPENTDNLGKIRVFTGDKGRAEDNSVYKLCSTTMGQCIRRPNPLEKFWNPDVKGGDRIRSLLPKFRDAAANIIVPIEARIAALRPVSGAAMDVSAGAAMDAAHGD